MTQKIMYFTAGMQPTETEQEEIDALMPLIEPRFEVVVRRGDGVGTMNYGAGVEATDYVAGSPPAPYDDPDDYPVADPENPPTGLPETQTIVNDGDALEIAVTGTYTDTVTFTVEGGVITAIVLS